LEALQRACDAAAHFYKTAVRAGEPERWMCAATWNGACNIPALDTRNTRMAHTRVRRNPFTDGPLSGDGNEVLKGHGVRSLGPGDSSDTGADMMGLGRGDDTSDRWGTGERASVDDDPAERYAADIATDRVVEADGAGLGDGLDQAEEAQLGITDEELSELDDDEE
jgi:hypothetical protein